MIKDESGYDKAVKWSGQDYETADGSLAKVSFRKYKHTGYRPASCRSNVSRVFALTDVCLYTGTRNRIYLYIYISYTPRPGSCVKSNDTT